MFFYFGYGSNMNMIALKAKGVTPVSSERAILHNWRLTFDVPHFFQHEGGVGNVHPSDNPNDSVHGILHECHEEDLPTLDELEALGVVYSREEVEVETYKSQKHQAYVYVGIPTRLDESSSPSERYLNILVNGAKLAKLDESYVEALASTPTHVKQDYPGFEFPDTPTTVFNTQSLAEHPMYTAYAGAVFDMSEAREDHDFLKNFMGGKDMTLFSLKRMDSSDGHETLDDIKHNRLSAVQKKYLNEYLHEYDVEYRYVGRFDYD